MFSFKNTLIVVALTIIVGTVLTALGVPRTGVLIGSFLVGVITSRPFPIMRF